MPKKTAATQPTDQSATPHDHAHDHEHTPTLHPSLSEGRTLDITIPWGVVDAAIQKTVARYQPHVKTDGFRKGKVPAKIVADMMGRDRLYQEAAEHFLPDAYIEAVKAADAKPLSNPDIHAVAMDEGQDWKFHAHIAEYPEFDLGDYKKAVKSALKDFDKELKEEEKKVKQDKDAKEMTKEEEEKAAAAKKDRQIDRILLTLQQTINPKVPELLVRQEVNRQLQSLDRQLQQLNIKMGSYLQSTGKKIEDLQAEYAAQSLATWQLEFILDTIATAEKIEPTDQEIDDIVAAAKQKVDKDQEAEQRSQIRHMLRKQKVLDMLLSLSA